MRRHKAYQETSLQAIIADSLDELGYDLVRVQFGATLQVMAQRKTDGDMDINDCENISRYLSPILDAQQCMPTDYVLEISSPGIDRPLVKLKDFERYKGHIAKIQTKQSLPEYNHKNFTARLLGISDEQVHLSVHEGSKNAQNLSIPYHSIAKAKLVLTDALLKTNQQSSAQEQ